MNSTFQHTALERVPKDIIRLLRIKPGVSPKPVEAQFRLARLCDENEFQAISYTWGSLPPSETISIDNKRFRIRKNLWDCLVRVRLPTKPTLVWVDAICINQDDSEERNDQVKLMAQIFSRAKLVVAWLGEAETNAGHILHPFVKPSKRLARHSTFLTDLNTCWDTLQGSKQSQVLRVWGALLQLCQLPYWTRMWIVQEIALAQCAMIQYGAVKIPWRLFASWANTMRNVQWDMLGDGDGPLFKAHYLRLLSNTSIYKLIAYQGLNTGGFNQLSLQNNALLADLIFDFRHLQCLDPRDKVYALLSLVKQNVYPQQIRVEYRSSITDLFFDVIASHIPSVTILLLEEILQEKPYLDMDTDPFYRAVCQLPSTDTLFLAEVLRESLRLEMDDLYLASQERKRQDEFKVSLVPVGVVRGVVYSKYKISRISYRFPQMGERLIAMQIILLSLAESTESDIETQCEHEFTTDSGCVNCFNVDPVLGLCFSDPSTIISAKPGDLILNLLGTTIFFLSRLVQPNDAFSNHFPIGRVFPLQSLSKAPLDEIIGEANIDFEDLWQLQGTLRNTVKPQTFIISRNLLLATLNPLSQIPKIDSKGNDALTADTNLTIRRRGKINYHKIWNS